MEIAGAVRKRKSGLSNEAVDFDQTFADNDACHAHPLFDMINRNSVQVEHPAAAQIGSQYKAAAFAQQRAGLVNL